tara:strand:+ start:536 stop:736 length:201 start_codon:yes stop_codon:yes gene_type:complete
LGIYAGAPSYRYQRGPDGQSYALGGEVSINSSGVASASKANILKMEVVRRAALAPVESSDQYMRVI